MQGRIYYSNQSRISSIDSSRTRVCLIIYNLTRNFSINQTGVCSNNQTRICSIRRNKSSKSSKKKSFYSASAIRKTTCSQLHHYTLSQTPFHFISFPSAACTNSSARQTNLSPLLQHSFAA